MQYGAAYLDAWKRAAVLGRWSSWFEMILFLLLLLMLADVREVLQESIGPQDKRRCLKFVRCFHEVDCSGALYSRTRKDKQTWPKTPAEQSPCFHSFHCSRNPSRSFK